MRSSILLVALFGLHVAAAAEKPQIEPNTSMPRIPCGLSYWSIDWHFPSHPQGFTTDVCDDGGSPAWEYGPPVGIPDPPFKVWGTVLDGDYSNDAGHRLKSPSFHVDEAHQYAEVYHYYDIETEYDGANVVVWLDDDLLIPLEGYPVAEISADPSYHAWCVEGEPGWSGSSGGWRVDCFDLSAYLGMDISLGFDFGSDESVTAPGWYLERIAIGGGVVEEAACCNPATGDCSVSSQQACLEAGGEWHPTIPSCDPNPCVPPPPPANLTVLTQGPDRIRLEWEHDPESAEELVIERKDGPGEPWEAVHIAPGDLVAWEDTTVETGSTYYYRVRASNSAGSSDVSNYAAGMCGVVPAAPMNLTATPIPGALAMRLGWTDNASVEIGFLIERKEGEFGTWKPLCPSPTNPVPPPADWSTWPDQDVIWEQSYVYRIAAYNVYGRSDWAESPLTWMTPDPGAFSATVNVRRGTQAIEDAEIKIRSGPTGTWVSSGFTDSNGALVVPGLHVGYFLRAVTMEQIFWDCRAYNGDGNGPLGVYLWRDSDTLDEQGKVNPFQIQAQEVSYDLELDHPVFRFDLSFSTEWDIPTGSDYWDSLKVGCQRTSDYLFDATDGQAALRKVILADDKSWWGEAHVQIHNYRETASARTNNYWDCDSWSPEEHIHVDSSNPEDLDWYSTVIHEFGHYAFDFKDEYQNGFGAKVMADHHNDYPHLHPYNHGIMQWEGKMDEFSSKNDYPPSYDYGCGDNWWCEKWLATEQLWERGQSCWDQLEGKLEGLTYDVNIRRPPPGWYVNGQHMSPDRSGPEEEDFTMEVYEQDTKNRIAPIVEFEILDRGPGSHRSNIMVEDDRGPAVGAKVYREANDQWTYLGRTDVRGRLAARGLRAGDDIRVYHRDADGVRVATGAIEGGVAPVMNLRVSPPARTKDTDAPGRNSDTFAPGAVVGILPFGEGPVPVVQLRFSADEPLGELPDVFCYHGAGGGPLDVTEMPGGYYVAEAAIDIADSLFDGSGLFEVTLRDTLFNSTTFVAPFQVDEAQAGEHLEVYQGPTEFNVPSEDVLTDQLWATISANAVPYRSPEPPGIPVTDMFSLGMRDDNTWPSFGSVNIAYDDSLLAGLDETSLVLAHFDTGTREWIVVDSSRVVLEANTTTGLVDERGVFCVFAGSGSGDETAPGPVEDLGGVPTNGLGDVELLWTAPGDDDQDGGAVQEYILGYSEEPFTEADWEAVPRIPVVIVPGAPGSDETAVVRLPVPRNLYYLGLRSKDEASNLSPLSNIAYAIAGMADPNLVPAPPTDLRAVDEPGDEGGAARLTWERSYDDGGGKNTVVDYVLYRNNPPSALPESLGVVPAGTTTYLDTRVENDTIYLYWVSASDGAFETMTRENRVLPARNTGVPLADFTSDGKVGVNDLAHLADTYGVLSSDPEFDPLFDLDADDQIWNGDAAILEELFFDGGVPTTDPPGQNGEASVFARYVQDEGELWHLDLSVADVSNLAGFQTGVDFPSAEVTFIGATGEVVHGEPPLLNRNGGVTPIFVVQNTDPNRVRIATAIQDASEILAPEGTGNLCRISFMGSGMESTTVLAVHLMDHEKRLNAHTEVVVATPDAATVLRPYLYRSYPNPCRTAAAMSFEIPERNRVTLRIFDVTGRLVRTLIDDVYEAGTYGALWDVRTEARHEAASGVYFYRLETEGYTMARKLLVLR